MRDCHVGAYRRQEHGRPAHKRCFPYNRNNFVCNVVLVLWEVQNPRSHTMQYELCNVRHSRVWNILCHLARLLLSCKYKSAEPSASGRDSMECHTKRALLWQSS